VQAASTVLRAGEERMRVGYSYLGRQFRQGVRRARAAGPGLPKEGWTEEILLDLRRLIATGDFTLGTPVREFERAFARFVGAKHAVGVNSGTDALFLTLKALGIGPGDEVVTAVNTFIATVGAIQATGARTRFVDCDEEFTIAVGRIERAITRRTKAVVPVHYTGSPVDMEAVRTIARRHKLLVIEDACQSIDAAYKGKQVGTWGIAGAFSLHPLKNLNIWGDGGMVVTDSAKLRDRLLLLRNHGMQNRDEYAVFGYNSRLDSVQAVVGLHVIQDVAAITEARNENARFFDRALARLAPHVWLPPRRPEKRHNFHLYMFHAEKRNALIAHLLAAGIDAKIHYPVPLHLQKCCRELGYARGDFPVAEAQAKTMLTLPVHQHLTGGQRAYVVRTIREFYGR
jgi:dTDP-3-amino-2,3,6-trideoxy-4-keto-D-glucose/dTDP-3-amino-3,4,6-trideoxy-alpha-D-glucose/dTDP-2,6-dideoxy-D-kanosamine transaminase